MNPGGDIVAGKPEKTLNRGLLAESGFRAVAQTVGKDPVRVQIHIENGLVVYAETLDYFETPEMLLIDETSLLVVLFDQILQLLFLCGLFLSLFCRIGQKHIEDAADTVYLDKMAVILHPADFTVFADDSVFHVVKVILAVRNLFPDALLHLFEIRTVNHSLKGISGQLLEFLQGIALENSQ